MATEQGRRYAEIALKELMRVESFDYKRVSTLAKKAWEISDNMMEQDKLRE